MIIFVFAIKDSMISSKYDDRCEEHATGIQMLRLLPLVYTILMLSLFSAI